MENRVGGQLFARTSRRVRLTPLGEQFRDLVRPAYTGMQEAFRVVRTSTADITGEMRIGVGTLPVLGPSFNEIVTGFQADHPACQLTFIEMTAVESLDRMRAGDIDVMTAWQPLTRLELTIGPVLSRQDRVLAVPNGHPLTERGFATVEDLADEVIPDGSAGTPEETLDAFHPRYTPSGRPIIRRRPARQTTELLSLVACGAAVHPTVASAVEHYRHPQVRFIPLHGLPPMVSVLVWPTARRTPAVLAFAEVARRFQPQHCVAPADGSPEVGSTRG